MAAVFPLDTSAPWTFNGVTYQYDAAEDRWFVISTNKTDFVDTSIETLTSDIDTINTTIDEEIENRTNLLDAAASKNNEQDSAILELNQRLDAVSDAAGTLQFKGNYQYVVERSEEACNEVYLQCLLNAGGDPVAAGECSSAHAACTALLDDPYPFGTFTTKGATNVITDVNEFIITGEDLDGQAIDWINVVEVNDYLEFLGTTDGDTALYEVIEEPKVFNTERTIKVKFIRQTGVGDGNFNLQEVYTIRAFKTSQGLDLTEADNRYIIKPYVVYFEDSPGDITPVAESGKLRNGELWFDTSSLEMFVYNNNAWVAASPPPSQDIVIQSVIADVDRLLEESAVEAQRLNSLISDLLLENNIYYGDNAPTGDITGTLRNGDIWIDSDDLTLKFYSGGAWINPDRTSGGDNLEDGGTITGPLYLEGGNTPGSAGESDAHLHMQNQGMIKLYDQSNTLAGYLRAINDKEVLLGTYSGVLNINSRTKYDYDAIDSDDLLNKNAADATYVKIADYGGGGTISGIPASGGTMTGTLISKTGAKSVISFSITNSANNKEAFRIWSPGGAGTEAKIVGRNGTNIFFQNYASNDTDVQTTAQFNYQNYRFKAKSNVEYSATDAHYFKSNVIFKNSSGDMKAKVSSSNFDFYNLARFDQGFVVKKSGAGIGGANSFGAYPDYTTYAGRIQQDNDVVNKGYVDGKAGNLTSEAGLVTISTPLDMSSNKIAGVNVPANPKDAANKQYVDDRIAELEARITALGG